MKRKFIYATQCNLQTNLSYQSCFCGSGATGFGVTDSSSRYAARRFNKISSSWTRTRIWTDMAKAIIKCPAVICGVHQNTTHKDPSTGCRNKKGALDTANISDGVVNATMAATNWRIFFRNILPVSGNFSVMNVSHAVKLSKPSIYRYITLWDTMEE